jgi:hypothetical protein
MAASMYTANKYAVGLNVPLALLYSLTARTGIDIRVSFLIIAGLVVILVRELIIKWSEKTAHLPVIAVLIGSLMFWSALLLVYGHVAESNELVYRLADVALYSGILLVIIGVFASYLKTRRAL